MSPALVDPNLHRVRGPGGGVWWLSEGLFHILSSFFNTICNVFYLKCCTIYHATPPQTLHNPFLIAYVSSITPPPRILCMIIVKIMAGLISIKENVTKSLLVLAKEPINIKNDFYQRSCNQSTYPLGRKK